MPRIYVDEETGLPVPYHQPNRAVTTACLDWCEGRWHVDGRGIHAGDVLELRLADGSWKAVRIESKDSGRILIAHFYLDKPLERFLATSRINVFEDELRWPLKRVQ